MRGRWTQRTPSFSSASSNDASNHSGLSTPIEVSQADAEKPEQGAQAQKNAAISAPRQLFLDPGAARPPSTPVERKPSVSSWGSGLGTFFARAPRFSMPLAGKPVDVPVSNVAPEPAAGNPETAANPHNVSNLDISQRLHDLIPPSPTKPDTKPASEVGSSMRHDDDDDTEPVEWTATAI